VARNVPAHVGSGLVSNQLVGEDDQLVGEEKKQRPLGNPFPLLGVETGC
jgi:hypothetical protein